MAKPRIFISSTFFDLKQIRSDLDRFIDDMGYEPVRNETGKIPYGKEDKLEAYCYKEVGDVEMLVGIVGGKFGSTSEKNYNYSITQNEIKAAIDLNKQIYLFIEKNVLSEYQTYLLNKDNDNVNYRFVDNVKIYSFLEEIFALPKNNVIHPFETAEDITTFLKEQWSGLFRDLLIQQSEKVFYGKVASKVNELTEVTTTLKTYIEEVLENVTKEKGKAIQLIQKETVRLGIAQTTQKISDSAYGKHALKVHNLSANELIKALETSPTSLDLKNYFKSHPNKESFRNTQFTCLRAPDQIKAINEIREILGLNLYDIPVLKHNAIKVSTA